MRRTTDYSLQVLAAYLPDAILLHILRPYMVKQRKPKRIQTEHCEKCGKLCWPNQKYNNGRFH
jgi:23S rRNA maturation mini-RNase III